jgi:hypothetical protein
VTDRQRKMKLLQAIQRRLANGEDPRTVLYDLLEILIGEELGS